MKGSHVIDVFFDTGFIQEWKKAFKIIKNILEEKRNSPEKYRGDFLDQTINDMATDKIFTEDQIVYLVSGIWFATCVSISSMVALIFKFLSEYPSVIEELRVCKHKFITSYFMNHVFVLNISSIKSCSLTMIYLCILGRTRGNSQEQR